MRKTLIFSILIAVAVTLFISAANNETADMIVFNATVMTVNDANPTAQAFAVKDGKFIAIGSSEEIKKYAGSNTQLIDAHGKTITPGFIDAHLHPFAMYPEDHRLGIIDLNPPRVSTIDDLIAILKKKAAITPKGEWIIGSRYDDAKLGRHPNRFELD